MALRNAPIVQGQPLPAKTHFLVLHEYPAPPLERLWRDFLAHVDAPAHYDSPEYFLEPYWVGQQPFAVLAFEAGQVIGVVTGIHHEGRIVSGLAQRPQINVLPGSSLVASQRLAEGLISEAARKKVIVVFSWSDTPLDGLSDSGFARRERVGVVTLDLKPGANALFKKFSESRRRNIRLASKAGMEISEAITPEDMMDYWAVYSAWRNTKRKVIVHSRTFDMIETVHRLRSNHRRFLARLNGKVIAATGLRFYSGGMVEYANNCSLDEFLQLRPNDLLVWKTIQWACENGFTKYSCGSADPFFCRLGGTIQPICRYRLDRTFLHRHELKENLRAKARAINQRSRKLIGEIVAKVTRKDH